MPTERSLAMRSRSSSTSDGDERPSLRRALLSPRYAAARLARSVRRRGLVGTLRVLGWLAASPVRGAVLAMQERRFDERYGVDTRGSRPADQSPRGDSVGYGAIQPDRFAKLVSALPVAPASLAFVDLGCGKGKALVLAAEAGFERCVGVELSPDLAVVARKNLAVRAIAGEVVETDAAGFVFPDGPLLVFLFNPFGESTLAMVLETLRGSLVADARPVFIGYVNAVHRSMFEECGFLTTVADGGNWMLLQAVQP